MSSGSISTSWSLRRRMRRGSPTCVIGWRGQLPGSADSETNAFNAELGLADAQFVELLSLVEIYRSLGGGWES